MKVYLVIATDHEEEHYVDKIFNNQEEAKKYAAFKNKYQKFKFAYHEYFVEEREVLDQANLNLNEDDLYLLIECYLYFFNDKEDEVEYKLTLKEDQCVAEYSGFKDFITGDIYIKLTKEEYDNFDQVNYEYIVKVLKEKIMKLHEQGMDGKEIADQLNKEVLS